MFFLISSLLGKDNNDPGSVEEEEDREHCAYCDEGHLSRDYLAHMALGHFKDAFVNELTKDFKCKRCIFQGK